MTMMVSELIELLSCIDPYKDVKLDLPLHTPNLAQVFEYDSYVLLSGVTKVDDK